MWLLTVHSSTAALQRRGYGQARMTSGGHPPCVLGGHLLVELCGEQTRPHRQVQFPAMTAGTAIRGYWDAAMTTRTHAGQSRAGEGIPAVWMMTG